MLERSGQIIYNTQAKETSVRFASVTIHKFESYQIEFSKFTVFAKMLHLVLAFFDRFV